MLYKVWRQCAAEKGSVEFFQKRKGQSIFDIPTVQSLIRSYRYKECVVRSAGVVNSQDSYREDMLDCYKQAVLDFTDQEKASLVELIEHNPRLKNKAWKFLKLASQMDWGYPFTLEDVVVLPDSILQIVTAKTLIHEHIHIEQRKHKRMFDDLYQDKFGYSRPDKLQIPISVLENTVTNPDGSDTNWIKKLGNRWYWSALMLQNGSEKPKGMAYECIISRPFVATVTEVGIPLAGLKFAFRGHTNTYHPNEFIASLWST